MERPDNEPKHESEQLLSAGGDERVEKSEADDLREPNATFLTDLNLLIVALSLSSIYNNEERSVVDTEMKRIEDQEANQCKACMPRLHPRKREPNDVKLMRRQTQRTQTTLKDFRRFRKM